jgi:acyl-CoA synthetase (AMP-forming)/AMP-acid ligase II
MSTIKEVYVMTLFDLKEVVFQNLNQMLDKNVGEIPDRIFLKREEQSMTYKQFHNQVIRLANVFLGLGVKKGDYVAIQLGNSFEYCIAIFGCYRIGAVATPLIPLWKTKEVGEALEKAQIETFIVAAGSTPIVMKAAKTEIVKNIILVGNEPAEDPKIKGRFNELLANASTTDPNIQIGWEDMASCHFTSGTTGNSKGVLHNHLGYLYTALIHSRTFKFKKPIYAVHVLPMYHIFGFAILHSGVYLQGTLKLLSKYEPQYILNGATDPEMSFFAGSPSIFNMLMAQENVEEFAEKISPENEVWVSGAGKLPESTENAINSRLLRGRGVMCNGYGSTEDISTGITTRSQPRVNCIGQPMEGVNIEIVDDDGNILPPGKDNVGMIANQSPAIMQGYLGNPKDQDPVDHQLTDPVLKPIKGREGIWYWSGDMAYCENGFYYLTDRAKDIVKTADRLVYPSEVEAVLIKHPDVKEVAVVGVPHEIYGETLLAVVVPRELGEEKNKALEAELAKLADEELAKYKVPRIWLFKPMLQTNAMGKVLKRVYRDEFEKKLEKEREKKRKAAGQAPSP